MQILPNGKTQWIDQNGAPLANGSVYFYAPGTTNPLTTYQDSAGTIANTNPIQLDSRGQAIVWGNSTYRQVVLDASGVTIWDQIVTASASVAALAGTGGASLIGLADGSTLSSTFLSNLNRVVDSIAALRAISHANYTRAFVTGYYAAGDGGGGSYWYDPSDTSSADNGGTTIVATDGGRWKLQGGGEVSVKQFGVKADAGTTDNSATLLLARNWVAANPQTNQLYFPAGIYGYSSSPNWAIQGASIRAHGEVRLRYSGTGNAVIIDTGATLNTFIYNVTMGPFIVECPSTAGHGVYVRSIHHSRLSFKVVGAGPSSDGIRVEFAVCTHFDNCTVTANEDGNWYLSSKPMNGIHLTQRNTGEQTSYCTFTNPVCEGLNATGGAGILLEGTLGNQFYGGTAESCYYGILTGTTATQNRFFGIDLESNSTDDIYDQGQGSEFHGVDSMTHITVSGSSLFAKFFGGNYKTILVGSGARYPSFSNVSYNRSSGGAFTNNEATTILTGCIDLQTQKIGPVSQGAVTVTASPFTYTNNTGNKQWVSIVTNGSNISAISVTRGGTNNGVDASTRQALLSPGDAVTVTYTTGLPTMYQYSE